MARSYLTSREVAERLGLTPNTVTRNAAAGVYPFAFDIGPRDPGPGKKKRQPVWRYDPEKFEAWLASRQSADPWAAPSRRTA